MISIRSFSLVIVIITFCFAGFSCNDQSAPYVDYLIKVDSIHIPDTVDAGKSFNIGFFGTVGFDGCHSFKTFNLEYTDQVFRIEALGTYDNTAKVCPTVMVSLDGMQYSMVVPVPGIYSLYVVNPDGYLGAKLVAR